MAAKKACAYFQKSVIYLNKIVANKFQMKYKKSLHNWNEIVEKLKKIIKIWKNKDWSATKICNLENSYQKLETSMIIGQNST